MKTVGWLTGAMLIAADPAVGGSWVVIGDSLSAEYASVLDGFPIPGVDDPTAYAAVTVEGWESMSWVEILGRLRPGLIHLGDYRSSLVGWGDLRFGGYEYNFASPGFTASQWADIVTSSLFSNPQFLLYRRTLEKVLREQADQVVIWLGGNEFRGRYGHLYDGADPTGLLAELRQDLTAVVDFVQAQRADLQIVLVTIPDLGFSPDKQSAHPDPGGQARVTAATAQANAAVQELAVARGLALADVFEWTGRLMAGEITSFGAVDLLPGEHPDNHPRYHFTRDGLHPNTSLQVVIARIMLDAFRQTYGSQAPEITDGEALALLGLDPDLPYWEWIAWAGGIDDAMDADSDGDGHRNLVEYALGMDPTRADEPPVSWQAAAGALEVHWAVDLARSRHVQVTPESSGDLRHWAPLPEGNVTENPDGRRIARLPLESGHRFLRLSVALVPVE
jgi:lysophospholipase L1-like esterase